MKWNNLFYFKELSKNKASKDVIIEESKTKDKSENIKKKKPISRSKETVVKEAVTKLKQSNKKESNAPTKKKEKSPTK